MPTCELLLHHISWLHTVDDEDRVLRNAYVAVQDGRVVDIGTGVPDWDADTSIDLEGCIVVPGLVNTHDHFFQTITRAVPAAHRTDSLQWLGALYPLWAHLDGAGLRAATRGAAAELLLTGATTSVDFSYLLPEPGMAELQVDAVRELGLRYTLVRGSLPLLEGDLGTRLRSVLGSRLDAITDDPDEVLAQSEKDLALHDPAPGSLTRLALGPTGVTYDNPAFMRDVAELAARHGAGLHTHLHPRPAETERARIAGFDDPIDLLDQSGWMREGTWLAHGTELSEADVTRMAAAGVGLAHCPSCVTRLGYSVAPLVELRDAGARVGVGVDGAASNDGSSMLAELRLAWRLHRVGGRRGQLPPSRWLTFPEVLRMATAEGAAMIGRDDVGQLVPGMMADLAAFRLDDRIDHAGALHDPLAALLMGGTSSRATLTVVGGEPLVRDGELVGVDERALVEEVARASSDLLVTATAATGIDFMVEST